MPTIAAPPPDVHLGTLELVAIADCTCSRDELDAYLDHIAGCQLCTGVVARLLGAPFTESAVIS